MKIFKPQTFFSALFSMFCLFACVSAQTVKFAENGTGSRQIPVVLIHGIGGSNLRQPLHSKGLRENGGFPNDVLKGPVGNPRNLQFTSSATPRTDTLSSTAGAVGFYDVPGKNITDLSGYLIEQKKYLPNKNLFEFAYDFRYSVNYNTGKLGEFIEEIKRKTNSSQVDIVAHSMGGLIAKSYLTDERRAADVRKLIFVGTPHLGAPKALKVLRYGDDLEVFLIDSCKLKRAAHNYPSMYNLLPGRRWFETAGKGYFYDEDDLDGDNVRGLLDFEKTVFNLKNGIETKCLLGEIDFMPTDRNAVRNKLNSRLIERETIEFHDRLDNWKKPEKVTVYNIVGYGVSTVETIVEKGSKISYGYTTQGDGTVPLTSAENAASDAIYYVNLGKLKLEHASMIGDKRICRQISELMEKGANVYIPETVDSRPQIQAEKSGKQN